MLISQIKSLIRVYLKESRSSLKRNKRIYIFCSIYFPQPSILTNVLLKAFVQHLTNNEVFLEISFFQLNTNRKESECHLHWCKAGSWKLLK